jgi:SOS response regulatory protein OraA/RecX
MPLRKDPPKTVRQKLEAQGFSQERIDNLLNGMQPYMTKHATEEELRKLLASDSESLTWKARVKKLLARLFDRFKR